MPAHYARAAFRSTSSSDGRLIVNVLHVEVDTLSDPVNWGTAAGDVSTWLTTLYRAMLPGGFTLHDLTLTAENYVGSDLGQGIASIELAGTFSPSDTKLNSALCAVLSFKTALAKRYARGHIFCPPPLSTTQLQAGGTWDPAGTYLTAVNAFGAAYVAGHTAGSTSYAPIVYSRTRANQAVSPYVFPIVSRTTKTTAHYLRSRLTIP